MDSRNKVLFIDWDGTLSSGRFWGELRESDSATYSVIQDGLFSRKEYIREWMRGEHKSEDICRSVASFFPCSVATLMDELRQSCESMGLTQGCRDVLRQLRRTHHLVLVTDNMDCFSRFTVSAQGLSEVFDRIINSADVQRLKDDENGESFCEYINEAGLLFTDAYLIDDSKATVSLFTDLGGEAYTTTGAEHTERLLRELLVSEQMPVQA